MITIVVAFFFVIIVVYLFTKPMRIRKKYDSLYVLITGCDTGFGRELAYRLDNLGFNVIATCLTENAACELGQTSSEKLITTQVDISKPSQISKLFETVKQRLPDEKALWGVVNNAGILGSVGPSEFLTRKNYIQCIDVNFFGMVEINRQFLPLLRNSRGRIVNMVSMAGKMAAPSLTCYTVSKFMAEGYSDCLRRELYHQGVSVHVIEPGSFSTQIMNADYKGAITKTFEQGDSSIQGYYGLDYPELEGTRITNFIRHASKHTYKVVNAYVDALTSRFPKVRYLVGLDGNVCVWFLRLPDWIIDSVMVKIGTLPAAIRKKKNESTIK